MTDLQAQIQKRIAQELSISSLQVEAVVKLLDEGATIPFIARYRKEATGSLDEVKLEQIKQLYERYQELEKRRSFVLESIESQGKLSAELRQKIENCFSSVELEDLYLPYKPKRRTRGQKAREKGLEPLAQALLGRKLKNIQAEAQKYFSEEHGLSEVEEVLKGARDIIAEEINEDAQLRQKLRRFYGKEGQLTSKLLSSANEEEAAKYKDYFDWDEPLNKAPSHRVLAMLRAEKEGFIRLSVECDEERAISFIEKDYLQDGPKEIEAQIALAAKDAYKRLLRPSLENEQLAEAKAKADETAISVFRDNLKSLLLASPLGQKRMLAIDPGLRTGCKTVCLDAQGNLLEDTVVYLQGHKIAYAENTILELFDKHKIEAIAIGNGTGGREAEQFIRSLKLNVPIVLVNESGASIYSASEVAREEFPDKDITVRGAVSIGRRLMDPLAELVKLDPKSIGVGQYQHDVHQGLLKESLDNTVMSCVNAVGVEVNTASKELLSYVSGLGPSLAQNIIKYRREQGAFRSRRELLSVSRLGNKAFEQAAGFLRIQDAENPLDSSAVHPERYALVEQMAKDLGCSVQELIQSEELRQRIELKRYLSEEVGMPTLKDILEELAKPGRDPRKSFEVFSFAEGVEKSEDLAVGMQLPGIVTNVTAFGAFVDVGVHQDGLVHVSQLADHFVKDPFRVVQVGQKVKIWVLAADIKRKRLSFSMKSSWEQALASQQPKRDKEK